MISFLFITVTILYVILIMSFVYGFDKITVYKTDNRKQNTTFSVIIPFRNEAENMSNLMTSILSLHYDNTLFEIILVDDDSNDDSVKIIESIIKNTSKTFSNTITIIQNKRHSNSPKKDALTSAISIAKNDWILTTDADCILPKYWLKTLDNYIQQHNPKMIVAPVAYHKIDSFLKRFQTLDFLSLMGATIGGFGIKKPFLCNGANLAYTKALFKNINGFEGNTNIASGDDIFIMEKALIEDKNSVHYLKSSNVIVRTTAQPTWNSLVAQRKRWAAKTSHYNSSFGKLTGLLVLLMNLISIIAMALALFTRLNWTITLTIILIKLTVDFILLFKTSAFFKQKQYLSGFLSSAIIYPFFSVYIAFSALFTSYKWKDREFKK